MENKKRGLLIILSGPSGSGKDSVLKEILSERENISLSISCTTRVPRKGEVDGKDYYFVDKEEFLSSAKQGKMLEYACYCENYYGTPVEKVENQLQQGNSVILEIEVQGALQVMHKVPEALTIFLVPPSMEELERRIRGRRTEDESVMRERLSKAEREIKTKDSYKHVVVNNTVEQAAKEIAQIIRDHIN